MNQRYYAPKDKVVTPAKILNDSSKSTRKDHSQLSNSTAYLAAMRALQEKVKILQQQINEQHFETDFTEEIAKVQSQLKESKQLELNYQLQINQLKQENDSLNQSHQDFQKQILQTEKHVQELREQIEILQNERVSHLKEYQDRMEKLLQKNEALKQENDHMTAQKYELEKTIERLRIGEKNFQTRLESIKSEDYLRANEELNQVQLKVHSLETQKSKLEKKIQKILEEKRSIEKQFEDYRDRTPPYKIEEQEKIIKQLKLQIDEKESYFNMKLKDLQGMKTYREEQMSKRIQELMERENENQSIIQQQNSDYKELQHRYFQLASKVENMDQRKKLSSMNHSMEEMERHSQQVHMQTFGKQGSSSKISTVPVKKLNLESLSAPQTNQISQRQEVGSERNQEQEIKKVIMECLEELNNKPKKSVKTITFNGEQENQSPKHAKVEVKSSKVYEIEQLLRDKNERYEMLIRQAQQETDFKAKATIRHELLRLTDEIKHLNTEYYQLSTSR